MRLFEAFQGGSLCSGLRRFRKSGSKLLRPAILTSALLKEVRLGSFPVWVEIEVPAQVYARLFDQFQFEPVRDGEKKISRS